jgi:hypothetical protein
VEKINVSDFLILLIGFVYGNLFVINYSTANWNFLLIFFIIFFVELVNKSNYFIFFKKYTENNFFLFNFINTSKRGFLLGIFVEAFKVGS